MHAFSDAVQRDDAITETELQRTAPRTVPSFTESRAGAQMSSTTCSGASGEEDVAPRDSMFQMVRNVRAAAQYKVFRFIDIRAQIREQVCARTLDL